MIILVARNRVHFLSGCTLYARLYIPGLVDVVASTRTWYAGRTYTITYAQKRCYTRYI